MSTVVDDETIRQRLSERKPEVDLGDLIPHKRKRGHSVILGWDMPSLMRVFKLMRCNGLSHQHRNPLERQEAFFDYHVHVATERYQLHGSSEEHYAEPTDAYTDLKGAIRHLLTSCSFAPPAQGTLL